MTDDRFNDDRTIDSEPSILLIDDDIELCELMREFLARRGFRLETTHDGLRGLARALKGEHDLILLDVMIPGIDGFELLRRLRRQSEVPVIMLTARTAQADRIAGLDSGADDYLPKPFGPEELPARIRAVLRRSNRARKDVRIFKAGPITLIPAERRAIRDGSALQLTTIEYDILELLVQAAGRIVSRDELSSTIHRRRASPFDRSIDVHVSSIRKKMGTDGDSIVTVRGVGYLFRSGVEVDGAK